MTDDVVAAIGALADGANDGSAQWGRFSMRSVGIVKDLVAEVQRLRAALAAVVAE